MFRQAFSLNGADPNLHAVRYWTLDDSDPNQLAAMLAVRAQDLDPEILAGTIFYRPNEENQAESFAQIATSFADENSQSGWTIQDLIAYIRSYNDAALNTILFGERGGRLDGRTMTALRRKMTAPGRIPSFIDPRPRANVIGNQRTIGNIDDLFTQPGLNVIRVSESNNRGYASFLSRLLQRASDIRAVATQSDRQTPDLEISSTRPLTSSRPTHVTCARLQPGCWQSRSGRGVPFISAT